jgi:mono/diheme cytochrome c family protein
MLGRRLHSALGSIAVGVLLLHGAAAAVAETNAEELTFEQGIRQILKTHCFHCHGEAGVKEGTLDLRLRRLIIQGGDSGPAIVPGDPDNSPLVARVQSGEMPPAEVKLRPTAMEIAQLEAWVRGGARTVREEPADLDPNQAYFTEEERQWWAYQPVKRPSLPKLPDASRAQSPIDFFILDKLHAAGLDLAPEADRATLARRLSFDLLGLPPNPEDLAQFLADDAPDAYERLVDRWLASPHYGERWGRHWLDVAGYADSEGYTEVDTPRPDAFRYRDYVIRSLNDNKPWDQFILEQLAGDELIGGKRAELNEHEIDCLVATGFLRMAPDGTASASDEPGVARNEVIAKTLEIVSTSLLGTTVACAQCHDHRYDPIPQVDYYSFRAIFEPAYDWRNWRTPSQRRVSLYTNADRQQADLIEKQAKQIEATRLEKQNELIAATLERELAKLPAELHEPLRQARATAEKERTPEQKRLLQTYPSVNVSAGSLYLYDAKAADILKKMAAEAESLRAKKPVEQFVRALYEPLDRQPPETFLFKRGDHEKPADAVPPCELAILRQRNPVELPIDDPALPTSGRRLAYARWLTSGQHPLVARVLMNRVWLHLMGRGIVSTPADFGQLGTRPSHPELLDWLAAELVESGWNLKQVQRGIVTSAVYKQSAQRSSEGDERDSDNQLYHRRSLRRLEAESLRDALLASSGKLNIKRFGPAVPVMADVVGQFVIGIENLNAGRPGAKIDLRGEEFRRSIYVQVRRSRPLSVLTPFDLPEMAPNCTSRASSTVATQSLFLMNGEFTLEIAATIADRARKAAPDSRPDQVRSIWSWIYGTTPQDAELHAAVAFLEAQEASFRQIDPPPKEDAAPSDSPAQRDALASFAHALLSSNRFLYVD